MSDTAQNKTDDTAGPPERWDSITLRYLGRLGELVRGGGGKLPISAGDPGEPTRKQTGHG